MSEAWIPELFLHTIHTGYHTPTHTCRHKNTPMNKGDGRRSVEYNYLHLHQLKGSRGFNCHNLESLFSSQSDIKEGISKFFSGCAWEHFTVECVVVIHCVYTKTFPTEWLWPPSHNSPWKCRVKTSKTFSRLFQSGAWNNTVTNTTRMEGYNVPHPFAFCSQSDCL